MDNCVVFRNKGLLDLQALTIMGVSAKVYDNPIGRFGTGLKYALAILKRHNHDVYIQIGKYYYELEVHKGKLRDKEFDQLKLVRYVADSFEPIEEHLLPFTTEYGKNWELWMAFRELYSNTIDEQGTIYAVDEDDDIEIDEDETAIIVVGEAFVQIMNEKADVFLPSAPVNKTSYVDIHEGQTKAVYNKGIKVAEFEKPMMHRYDITGYAALSEDRKLTSDYYFNSQLADSVTKSDDEELIEKIVTAQKDYHESDINFDRDVTPSDTFLKTVKRLIKKGKDSINPTVVRLYESFVKKVRAEKKDKREKWTIVITVEDSFDREDIKEHLLSTLCRYDKNAKIYLSKQEIESDEEEILF